MIKKKDALIEEAEKIKADLDALKKKKKTLDATKTKKLSETCKGICKKFKVKRPSNGKRYDSGQGRCQICEQWIDYHGAHLKNKVPATENSIGWYCNCCNYRIRKKPRNKVYKEKLAEDIAQKEKNSLRIKADVEIKTNKISSIQNQIGIILHQIKNEEEEIKKYEKSGIKKLLGRISRENKSQYEYLKTGITKKKNELVQLELELKNKVPSHNANKLKMSITEKQISKNDEGSKKESIQRTEQIRPKLTNEDIENFLYSRNLTNPQPYRSVLIKFIKLANQFLNESILKVFENRFIIEIRSENTVKNQRSIIKNFENYLESHNTENSQDTSDEIFDSDEQSKTTTAEINNWITYALILIRSRPNGILQNEIQKLLSISNENIEELIPKLLRIEDILSEEIRREGILINRILKPSNNYQKPSTSKKVKEVIHEKVENVLSKSNDEIKNVTFKMITEYIYWKNNISKKFKIELIDSYLKYKSISKVYEKFSSHTKQRIRLHLVTDLRLPPKLKTIENSGGLHSNPTCSIVIALYATDYFNWDGEDEKVEKIIELARAISNYLQSDSNLNKLFEGRK